MKNRKENKNSLFENMVNRVVNIDLTDTSYKSKKQKDLQDINDLIKILELSLANMDYEQLNKNKKRIEKILFRFEFYLDPESSSTFSKLKMISKKIIQYMYERLEENDEKINHLFSVICHNINGANEEDLDLFKSYLIVEQEKYSLKPLNKKQEEKFSKIKNNITELLDIIEYKQKQQKKKFILFKKRK